MSLITITSLIIGIISILFLLYGNLLLVPFNIVFRDWTFILALIILVICGFTIEIVVFNTVNNRLKKKVSAKKIWKEIIQVIATISVVLINICVLFIFVFAIVFGYKEIGVESHDGKKYVIRDTGWMTPDHIYNYHPYKNVFWYGVDTAYRGENKWGDFQKDSDSSSDLVDESELNDLLEETNEDIGKEKEMNIQDIKVDLRNIEYVQKIDDNVNYGFYLVDRAASSYLYAFVKSEDGGLSWKVVSLFPATSEMYYGVFLDHELGFANFGPSNGLSLFKTSDCGSTWKTVTINIPEPNKHMLYVHDIKRKGESIELILGNPSWADSDKRIKYNSMDNGLSWHLIKE